MNKCKDCEHWKQNHKKDGYMGCALWNGYKHWGRKPYTKKGDIQCPACGHEINLKAETNEENDKNKADMFDYDLEQSGLKEVFEGWVGKGMLTNSSIITKADDCCKYFSKNKNL